jgi:hypothetical protein
MPEEPTERRLSKFSIEEFNRANNKFMEFLRKTSGELLRLKSVYTPTFIPIEEELKRAGLVEFLGSYISALASVENMWSSLQEYWIRILNCYAGIGLFRGEEITSPEIWMCKFGSRLTLRELQVALEEEAEDPALSYRKKEKITIDKDIPDIPKDVKKIDEAEAKRKLDAEIAKGWTTDDMINEDGLDEEQIKERRERLRKELSPLDNPSFVEWRPIKLKVGGKEIIEEFPLPREVMANTWNSPIDDVNFALDRYPVRFFGFEKQEDWTNALETVTTRICKKVKMALEKSEDFKNGILVQKESGYIDKVIMNKIKPGFIRCLKEGEDSVMQKVVLFDSAQYPYLRTRTQTWAGKISDWESEVNGLMYSTLGIKVHYQRTYKIIDSKRVVKARVYNNGYLLYNELLRLNKMLRPKDRFEDFGLTASELKVFEDCKKKVDIPTLNEADMAAMDEKDMSETTTVKGPFHFYFEEKYRNNTNYMYFLTLEKKLKRKFEEVNERLRAKGVPGYYLTWEMMGVNAEEKIQNMERAGVNSHGWPFDERSPGMDENGWPFEVRKDGTICLDGWEHRKVRKVPPEFVVEMDMLLKINIMNNEYDAIRDDLRDGRYHLKSLTIYEYILALMAKWGPEGSKLIQKEFKNRWRRQTNMDYSNAEYQMQRFNDQPEAGKRRPSDLNPAFDLRAVKMGLVGITNWRHLGRKRYYETADSILNQLNEKDLGDPEVLKAIGPTLTTRGISMYIIEKVMANVRDFDEAGKILVRIANEAGKGGDWYDYGPRGFNKPGPKNPLKLNIQELTSSLEAEKMLKMYQGVTSLENDMSNEADPAITEFGSKTG